MKYLINLLRLFIVVEVYLLTGCGGGGGGGGTPPPPPQGTFISGQVLDTNAFVNGQTVPIANVAVSFIGEAKVVMSDAQGNFALDNLTAGDKVLDMDASGATPGPGGVTYSSFRENISIASGANTITRPFYLPRIDTSSLTTVDPNQTTVVTNPALGITLTVAAGSAMDQNGNLYTGQLSISEVPNGLAPAALPAELEPGLLFTIQPVGVIFTTPATLSIRNDRDNWAPGSTINFWSLDPDTGTFSIVGVGAVSSDGSMIDTVSGGVRAADWHGPLPPAADAGTDQDDNDGDCQGDGCCKTCKLSSFGSEVQLSNGRFSETINLPVYISQGRQRGVDLVYASDRAYPLEVMTVAPVIETNTPIPTSISYQGALNAVDQGYDRLLDTTGMSQGQDDVFRIALPLDGTQLATDSYVGEARISSHYPRSTVSGKILKDFMVINDINSEFGAGWRLMDVDRIYPATSGGVVLVDGLGYPRRFKEANGSGSIVTIIADAPTFNDVAVMQTILTEMGLPFQLRTVFANSTEQQISMGDIANTSLFIWMVGNSFPYFGFAADTVEERSNTLTVLEAAVAQGVPILAPHLDPSPRDTGFFINPACCVRDPETGQQENLTGMRRSSNWDAVDAPLGSQRLWQLLDPNHPIFNGSFGTIAPDLTSPVTNGLGTALNFSGRMRQPQLLNGSEVPLVRAYQDNGTTTALTNEYPIVITSHAPRGTPSLTIGLSIGNTAPVDSFTETLIKNSISWLLSSVSTVPGQLLSPAGDYSTVILQNDGTYTRRTKTGDLYTFDTAGYLQTVADRNGNTTTYTYDANNQLTRITDPVGKQTQLVYNNGKLSTVTDPSGRVTSFTHDAQGDLTMVTFPDNSTRQFTYDALHLMTSQTNQRGFTNTYSYNVLGQAISSTQADGSVRTITPSQSIGLGQ